MAGFGSCAQCAGDPHIPSGQGDVPIRRDRKRPVDRDAIERRRVDVELDRPVGRDGDIGTDGGQQATGPRGRIRPARDAGRRRRWRRRNLDDDLIGRAGRHGNSNQTEANQTHATSRGPPQVSGGRCDDRSRQSIRRPASQSYGHPQPSERSPARTTSPRRQPWGDGAHPA